MDGAEAEPAAQGPTAEPPSGIQAVKKKNRKRKQPQHSADIVFTKGASIQTIASLSKLLKEVTEPIVGLQYVWEYRSPSKSVPPHYQCKLCAVSRLQHDMLAHVKGWKHSYRYVSRAHPDKVTCEEEEGVKDPSIRKKIKEIAAEVEETEGRGQLKVILKEPYDVHAFKGLRTAFPKLLPPAGPGVGPKGAPFGGRFSNSMFSGEYPSQGGSFSDLAYGESGMGGYSGFPGGDMDLRRFSDDMSGHQGGGGGDFGLSDRRDSCGNGGPLGKNQCYQDEFRGNQMGRSIMDRPMDRPMGRSLDQSMDRPLERPSLMGAVSETNSLPATLLGYLDTFRIESENDAQIVLKVTQKLTDVLMEYRLRSVSSGPSMNSSLNNSKASMGGYSPPRMSGTGDRYAGSLMGSSRFSDGPQRFYN
ncbi:uncharacterized protein si:ch211-197h24.6 [Lampris incognitus]|uniref:uncharacterized protein si:ch211-197h24.6 n=1 Tax=Lampris incognitus TaxID=2546036 RepID=UPI0024B48847|nr:uncharacterized protein si:ch211-197h24.6 [Lampris incognitus]